MSHPIGQNHVPHRDRREDFFRINVDHPSAGRSGTGIFTKAYTSGFLCYTVPFPFHFRAYEFQGGQFASQVRLASFSFHWQRSVMWAARDAVFVKGIAIFFHREFYSQRNKGFFKSEIPKSDL